MQSIDKDNRIDLICQHTVEGEVIPLRIRLKDEDSELQEYTIKGYRDKSSGRMTSFECQILVRDALRVVNIFSSDLKVWHINY